MQSKHLLEIAHATFQVNAVIFVGAKPKKEGKMSFLQHFTVFKKKNFKLNIFLTTWSERGALPEIQTSGCYGRAFFFDLSKPPQ